VLAALGAGRLTPDAAAAVLGTLSSQMRIEEIDDLAERLAALEQSRGACQEVTHRKEQPCPTSAPACTPRISGDRRRTCEGVHEHGILQFDDRGKPSSFQHRLPVER